MTAPVRSCPAEPARLIGTHHLVNGASDGARTWAARLKRTPKPWVQGSNEEGPSTS
jgi:hypothetical protein